MRIPALHNFWNRHFRRHRYIGYKVDGRTRHNLHSNQHDMDMNRCTFQVIDIILAVKTQGDNEIGDSVGI